MIFEISKKKNIFFLFCFLCASVLAFKNIEKKQSQSINIDRKTIFFLSFFPFVNSHKSTAFFLLFLPLIVHGFLWENIKKKKIFPTQKSKCGLWRESVSQLVSHLCCSFFFNSFYANIYFGF